MMKLPEVAAAVLGVILGWSVSQTARAAEDAGSASVLELASRPQLSAAQRQDVIAQAESLLLAGAGATGRLLPPAGDAVDLLLSRDYAILHDAFVPEGQPLHGGPAVPGPDGKVHRLQCFWRALVSVDASGHELESALLVHVHHLNEAAGVVRVRAVEGGVCYLAGDGRLHWLTGGRLKAQAPTRRSPGP